MDISFVIPTLNEEKILERTLLSIRQMDSLKYEIIVSDGGSSDRTLAIARRYADIVVEKSGDHRQTIAEGRNEGAARASGQFLVFLDADVFIENMNDFFERTLKRFTDDPKLVALTAPLLVLRAERTKADFFFSWVYVIFLFVMNNLLRSPVSQGEFQMVRTSAFRHIEGYDKTIVAAEDMELFMRLSKIGRIRFETSLVVYHTGRRAHKIGWLRMWRSWIHNGLSVKYRRRSVAKEWEVIR